MKTYKLNLSNISNKLSSKEMKMVIAGFSQPTITAHCSDGSTATASCPGNGNCAAVDGMGATCDCDNGKSYLTMCKNAC